MTSRYRAAQRAVELVARLQDEGLTVDEIAAEMRRLNVSTRQGGNDPAADLCASVQDMVADFAKAMGQPPAEESALRTRAEAAEAALAQARAEGEAAGYRRAVDDTRAADLALHADERLCARGGPDALAAAEDAVRELAAGGAR